MKWKKKTKQNVEKAFRVRLAIYFTFCDDIVVKVFEIAVAVRRFLESELGRKFHLRYTVSFGAFSGFPSLSSTSSQHSLSLSL